MHLKRFGWMNSHFNSTAKKLSIAELAFADNCSRE